MPYKLLILLCKFDCKYLLQNSLFYIYLKSARSKMITEEEEQSNLRYQLKINDMILMTNERLTLTECIASILGIESTKLHQIICNRLEKWLIQFTLPRKLNYIRKDISILEDYRKYPALIGFMKITLQMVSQIYQTKITVFSLSKGLLVGVIVNEKGYQQQIKVGRIGNRFYQVKDCLLSHQSSGKHQPSSSSQSYKLYQAFDIEPLPKKFEHKLLQSILTKSYSQLQGSPALKKNLSLCEDRAVFASNQSPILKPIIIPNLGNAQLSKQFDQLSLQNALDQQDIIGAQQLTESMNFNRHDLTQSLKIQKGALQAPTSIQQAPIVTPPIIPQTVSQHQTQAQIQIQPQTQIQSQPQSPPAQVVPPQQATNPLQQPISVDGNAFYGYYSHHMYYPPYMMGQGSSRNDNYNASYNSGLATSVSLSPGKNIVRRQNSTLEINENQRYTGRLKFFDEGKNYGFIIMDADQSDIFVHCDDLQKAGISKERVRSYKQSDGIIRFSFKVMSYFGKYRESRKAVDLIILDDGLGMPALYP